MAFGCRLYLKEECDGCGCCEGKRCAGAQAWEAEREDAQKGAYNAG